ncbi:type I-B CRISPR-associated protein Cas5b [Candidatus Stoquefichus massiliensis]|uniref:type I-B CRISPR-associated protein Cas5b n=1 Tax=Candidatus Stoquefichus massiliensis TaxID=1470350 RepID=UPI000480C054|nr:type I-B CRISPR-associated protein Cas5b [Candidatus Stoquefichus massiliensis]
MKAIKFTLRGKTAFFKNPEVNTYYYFTYGNIHKPALLGIFGAILGYRGYESEFDTYPQYYEKLKDISVSIVPHKENGHFYRKIQYFNNSVGYASHEQGGNLVVKEQWLENPEWSIYVLIGNEESQKLAEMIMNKQCVYTPYLGKNDHLAIIEDTKLVELQERNCQDIQIHSLSLASMLEYNWRTAMFKYEEYLPISLKESTNHYQLEKMLLTDAIVKNSYVPIYSDGEINVTFY